MLQYIQIYMKTVLYVQGWFSYNSAYWWTFVVKQCFLFQNCKEIEICYDIGLVAPVFAHENDRFPTLTTVEVHESHVLYKADLLDYLRNAPSTVLLYIHLVNILFV